jgi:hypothetical protein
MAIFRKGSKSKALHGLLPAYAAEGLTAPLVISGSGQIKERRDMLLLLRPKLKWRALVPSDSDHRSRPASRPARARPPLPPAIIAPARPLHPYGHRSPPALEAQRPLTSPGGGPPPICTTPTSPARPYHISGRAFRSPEPEIASLLPTPRAAGRCMPDRRCKTSEKTGHAHARSLKAAPGWNWTTPACTIKAPCARTRLTGSR